MWRPLDPEAPGRDGAAAANVPLCRTKSCDTSSLHVLRGRPQGWGERGWVLERVGEGTPLPSLQQ